jgi:hypothetical protein
VRSFFAGKIDVTPLFKQTAKAPGEMNLIWDAIYDPAYYLTVLGQLLGLGLGWLQIANVQEFQVDEECLISWVTQHLSPRYKRTKEWEDRLMQTLLAWGMQLPEYLVRICKNISVIQKYAENWKEYDVVRRNAMDVSVRVLRVRERRFEVHSEKLRLDKERALLQPLVISANDACQALIKKWQL